MINHKDRNFLTLYNYLCGQTEIPKGFHGWTGLSMLAALTEKRVWFEKFKGSKIYPNIYTFLVGPASIGKGGAISHAMRILKAAELSPPLNVYRGSLTYAYLEDLIGKDEDNNCLWLIMDELANNLGDKKMSERFIKMMTELYTGDYDFSAGTRTHGGRLIEEPCISWHVGTTKNWLFDVIGQKEIFSGFTARVFFCFREYDDKIRYAQPKLPDDFDEVLGYLVSRIRAIHITEGPFTFSEEAQRIKDKWYMTRPRPADEDALAAWKRGDDLVIKLCMIYSLAENTNLIIQPHHFIRARSTFDNAFKDLDMLMDIACTTEDTERIKFVEGIIKGRKSINRTALGKLAYKRGIIALKLDSILKDIESRGVIVSHRTKTGSYVYDWAG